MSRIISGATMVAAVAGRPIDHTLSPLIHNTWIEAAGLDAVYIALSPPEAAFTACVEGLRGGVLRGLNVTAPFKETALALADQATARARAAGAANLIILSPGGPILADNTDGEGLLDAFARQTPGFDPAAGPVLLLGAGGAVRGAAAAFLAAGAPQVRILNRTPARARPLNALFGERLLICDPRDEIAALQGAQAIINATPTSPTIALDAASPDLVVMDMAYRPIRTPFLERAAALGLRTVDGLEMLIGQARPAFEALFETPVPDVDVRAQVLSVLGLAA
jgi:shikimate dehydrogenase